MQPDANAYARLGELLPNSIYAQELQKNSGKLRFSDPIEAEYRAYYLGERRMSVRWFNGMVALGALVTLIMTILSPIEPPNRFEVVRLSAMTAIYAVLFYVASSGHYHRYYPVSANVGVTLFSLIVPIEVSYRVVGGQGALFALLTTYSFALYFLTGILFQSALVANVLMVLSLAASMTIFSHSTASTVSLVVALVVSAAVIGMAFYKQGVRFRRSFLERCLIAELAARDALTGLRNRGAFDEHLVRIWQQALRTRCAMAVLMIDVDCFKAFNDRYGHQKGDAALCRIAEVVGNRTSRPFDISARYGGEEFAVVLYDASAEYAKHLAEHLRTSVQALAIEHLASTVAGVATVSIGVAFAYPTLGRSAKGLVQLADEALYSAKGSGRNRIVVFEKEYLTLSTGKFKRGQVNV